MPAYTTQSDLEERYGTQLLIQLTDRGALATGTIDESVVAKAIAKAESLINGYLAVRYVLPLSTIPDPVPEVAERIAIYGLHVYAPDEKIKDEYKEALAMLRDISKGVIQLAAEGVPAAPSGGGGVEYTEKARPFTDSTMKGFI